MIRETCTCGAHIEVSGDWRYMATAGWEVDEVARWRRVHPCTKRDEETNT